MSPLRTLFLASFSASVAVSAAPQPSFHEVFRSGADGYASVRIPALLVTKKGTVLAAAEGRQRATDQAQNDIIAKRSTDGGLTWGKIQLLHDDGVHSLNNPTLVQDANTGRVFLWYQRIPGNLTEHSKNTATGLEGENIYRNFILTTDDEGLTWSQPQDITATTKRPERATTIASGPGMGIQLTRGPRKGRLIIPFNEGPYGIWQNYAVLSDDGGKTWTYGQDVPGALIPNGKGGQKSWLNEVQMVELSDGTVRLDSRQFGGNRVRKTSLSHDGGHSWSAATEMPEITDPSCMAGVLRYSWDDFTGRGLLLHTGPDHKGRANGTIWLSVDDGATWPVKKVLFPGNFAYSVPGRLADGTLGVLFEADNYQTVSFARVSPEWLTEGTNFAAVPESRWETTGKFGWWPARHAAKLEETKRLVADGVDVVFVGDSITQNWETAGAKVWAKHFGSKKVANYGFSGDSTQHVLWRLQHDEFTGLQPKVFVVNIGTNNTKHGPFSPEEIAAGVKAVVTGLREKCPNAQVLLLGIFPRGKEPADPYNQKAVSTNKILASLATEPGVTYADLGSHFTKEMTPDFLHLNEQGYAKWAEALEPLLEKMQRTSKP